MGVRYIAIILLYFFSIAAYSAEVRVGNDQFDQGVIFISGVIEKGDYDKVVEVATNYIKWSLTDHNALIFLLDSEGGDVEEAIKIGLFFRKTLSEVYVWGNRLIHENESEAGWVINERAKGRIGEYRTQNYVIYKEGESVSGRHLKKCYSACALMFLGGAKKELHDNYFWIGGVRADESKDIPVIGLHRPYYDQAKFADLDVQSAEIFYKKVDAKVRGYLSEINVSQELVDRIFKTASTEIDLVEDDEFRGLINPVEPYFQEWILAKCGSVDDGKNVLSDEDYQFMRHVKDLKREEVDRQYNQKGGDYNDYMEVYFNYMPEDVSAERYEKIMASLRAHTKGVQECERSAVKSHQFNLFKDLYCSSPAYFSRRDEVCN